MPPIGSDNSFVNEEISKVSAEVLLNDQEDGSQGLKPLKLPQQAEESLVSGLSLVCTPFAIPLSPSKLVPPLAPPGGLIQEFGPKTAEETLLGGLVATPKPSILGPRPTASAPVRRKKGIPPSFTP